MLPVRSLLLVWALAAGCSPTGAYRRPASPAEAAKILSGPGNRQVELVVESPRGPEARYGTLSPFDARTFIVTGPSGQRFAVPFQDTRSITYKDRGQGALVGFLIGAIPGFLTGFVAGNLLGNCNAFRGSDETQPCTSHSFSTGMGMGAIGGLLTGGIGAAIGAAVGKNTTITF